MPARPPWPPQRHPVRDLPALFGVEHIGGIRQRLRDALARRFGKPDLLRAQALDCTTIDGGRGQERHRLGARGLRLLAQRPQMATAALAMAGTLGCWSAVGSVLFALFFVMWVVRLSVFVGVWWP